MHLALGVHERNTGVSPLRWQKAPPPVEMTCLIVAAKTRLGRDDVLLCDAHGDYPLGDRLVDTSSVGVFVFGAVDWVWGEVDLGVLCGAGEVQVLLHGVAGLGGVVGADGAVDLAVHFG